MNGIAWAVVAVALGGLVAVAVRSLIDWRTRQREQDSLRRRARFARGMAHALAVCEKGLAAVSNEKGRDPC